MAGGFNEKLQSEEYTELSIRLKGSAVRTTGLTVLHLEPETRFTLKGYLLRRFDVGFWYQALHYLHPKRAGYAFPFKLPFVLGMIVLGFVFHSFIPLAVLICVYLAWLTWRFQLARRGNIISFAIGNFARSYDQIMAAVMSVLVLTLGEIAGEAGKLWGVFRSPTRVTSPDCT